MLSLFFILPPAIFYMLTLAISTIFNLLDGTGKRFRLINLYWYFTGALSYIAYYLAFIFIIPPCMVWRLLGIGKTEPESGVNDGTVVILVNGYLATSCHWFLFKWRLERILGKGRVATFSYRIFGGSLDDWSNKLAEKVNRLNCKNVILLGQSLGGLISFWAAAKLKNGFGSKTIRVISLGSPFAGSKMASFAVTSYGRKLRPGMPEIANTEELLKQGGVAMTSYWSEMDLIIIPSDSAAPCATDEPASSEITCKELEGVSHAGYYFIDPKRVI
ncbi:MAG: alpha/beta hydrolase [Nitrospinota bacterium]|nr:alpha/beta hydrolase [Nitrospinota bacterium]